MAVVNIQSTLDEAMKTQNMDSETAALVSKCISCIDSDKDGRIDHFELVNFAISLTKQVSGLKKQNFNLKFWGKIIAAVALLLVLSTFASSTAAVFVAKDMKVNQNTLMTNGNEPVKTSVNEIEATIGALAFLPAAARKHVNSVAFKGEDSEGAVDYEKQVASIVVHSKKSVIVTTTEGDTLTWNVDDNKDSIRITLAGNGEESWLLNSGCEKCTILNVMKNEEVSDALDEYHGVIGKVLHERGRVLHELYCAGDATVHTHTSSFTCMLPLDYKPYFLQAKTELIARIQAQVTQELTREWNARGYDNKMPFPNLPKFDEVFDIEREVTNKLFDGVDAFLAASTDAAVDIGQMLYNNLQKVGGEFAINIICSTDEQTDPDDSNTFTKREWKMDTTIIGTLPSATKVLNATGVGTAVVLFPPPFPELDLVNAPRLTVDCELTLPVAIDLLAKTVTLKTTIAKINAKLDTTMSQDFSLDFIPGFGSTDTETIRGGFVVSVLLTFAMNARSGTIQTDNSVAFLGSGGSFTASGGYLANLVLPMLSSGRGGDKSITFRAVDANIFDTNPKPCVTYDIKSSCVPTNYPCGLYPYSSYWSYGCKTCGGTLGCTDDMCEYPVTLNSAFGYYMEMLEAADGVCPISLTLPSV